MPIAVADPKAEKGYRIQNSPLLLPHRVIGYLFNHAGLEISPRVLEQYWDRSLASKEPHASEESRGRIPLGFYGDSAQLFTKYKKENLTCLFINIPIFRPKSVRFGRYLIWCQDTKLLYKNRSLNTILRWVVWSFNCLYTGLHPSVGPGGQPLSDVRALQRAGSRITRQGHLFQLVECRGDWEWHKKVFRTKAAWQGNEVCYRCPAMGKGDASGLYFNFTSNSSWWDRDFDSDEFIQKMLPDRNMCISAANMYKNHGTLASSLGPLVHSKAFHPYILKFCTMHILNLGILMALNGGVLHLVLINISPAFPAVMARRCILISVV